MEHYLKLRHDICDAVLSGDKTFEIRKNDRFFQKGDLVKFKGVSADGSSLANGHYIEYFKYKITYVISGFHVDPEYVVFSFKKYSSKEPQND